jgi:hypothetical protein
MQKVLAILEKYVEFIVLGLGALFLVFMAWMYLVQTPVTIPVGGQNLRPGEIDNATVHGPVDLLDREMAGAKPPKVQVPNFTEDIRKRLDTEEPPPFETLVFTAPPGDAAIKINDTKNPLQDQAIVKSLPKIPPAEIADLDRGRTNVVMPPADWQPGTPLPVVNLQPILNPTPIAPATPARPGQPGALLNPASGRPPTVNGVAPAAPAAAPLAPAAPGAPAPPILADKDWVTVMYKIPMKAIGQAFTDANIPQGQQLNLFKTCVLNVELVRQEIVDGKPYGEETVVKKLEVSNTPPFPNGLAEEMQYVGWASNNQGQIIQPGFFQIARGDPWLPPGVVDTTVLAQQQLPANQPFDVNRKYTPEETRNLTLAQKKAIRDAKDAAARARIKGNAGGNTGRGNAGDTAPPDEGNPTVPDLSRMQFAQAAPRDVMTPEEQAEQGDMNPDNGGDNGFQQPQMAPAAFAQFPLPPTGEYDPRTAPDPTIGWATDDTVEPGKSYHYKVRYKIKNPVFQTINVAQPKNLAGVFAITSPDSGWTEPVSIPPLTRFFVASLFNNKVSLEIFRWQNGQLHSTKVNVSPGDMIAYKDPSGIDYSTGWTLVDITVDPGRNNRPLIIVADPSGKLVRRDFESDSNDPEFQKMKSLITPAVAQR